MRLIKNMELDELIEYFNVPCDTPFCRTKTNKVNDDYCMKHRRIMREIEIKKNENSEK